MKRLKALLCAALSVCVVSVPLVSTVVFNAGAEENVQSLQQQLQELNSKSKEYEAVLEKTQTDISEKEAYSEALLGQVGVLNDKIIVTRKSIEETNKKISKKEGEIETANGEIQSQVDALCERLRIIYKAGSASYLEIILGSKDFSDFIDKVSLVRTLSNYDKGLIEEINGKLDKITEQKTALEADKTELETQEASLNSDIEGLNKLIEENEAVLSELSAQSKKAQEALQKNQSQSSAIESEIAAYFAQQEAAKAASAEAARQAQAQAAAQQQAAIERQQNSNSSSESENDSDDNSSSSSESSASESSSSNTVDYDDSPQVASSGYTWPCPGFYYLSSLWNEDRYTYNHGAIDIAGYNIQGAAVVAADSGTVSYTYEGCPHNYGKAGNYCYCGGGFGNYVWLNHGNGKETIYAHLTSVVVSEGQYVSKGQVVGYVGSTGNSTGPHLHFECRYNGVKYNPMDELSAYWGSVSY